MFYQPSNQGYEDTIRLEVARKREAQLAAVMESDLPEVLTFGPTDKAQEQWLQRTLGNAGEQLRQVCDLIYALLKPQRHHVLLDLNAGLLTWEALRQVPEGGVYACAPTPEIYAALTEQAQTLTDLARPILLSTPLQTLPETLMAQASDILFDGIVGRNAIKDCAEPPLQQLANHLAPQGRMVLAETIPFRTLRLYSLLSPQTLPAKLFKKLQKTEDSLYTSDPDRYWDVDAISGWFQGTGLVAEVELIRVPTTLAVTRQLRARWLGDKSRYMHHLTEAFTDEDLSIIRQAYHRDLGTSITWETHIALVTATHGNIS